MIVSSLIYLAAVMITLVSTISSGLGFLLPDVAESALQEVVNAIYLLDFIFPVDTLLAAIIIIIEFEVAVLLVNSTVSVVNWIRGSGEIKV